MKRRLNIMVSPATETEIKVLISRDIGKNMSQTIDKAVHALFVATAETKPKAKKP